MIKNCMKRNVVSIQSTATIREAADKMVDRHVGFLPVLDHENKIIGMVGLPDLLTLELPAFFNLLEDLDFMSDFGAVETTRPAPAQVDALITSLMQPAITVFEDSGLLYAYGLMLKHNLSDIPVISENEHLVGMVSRVDIGTAILSSWKEIGTTNP
jgi:CBS domain-containing protein